MRLCRVPLLVVSLLVLASSLNSGSQPDCNVPIQTVLKLQNSGIGQAQDWVILNQEDWCQFWDRAYAMMLFPPPCPEIDFDSYVVVVTALGRKSNGCYNVEIDCIERDAGDNLTVYVNDIVPGPRCFCTMMIVHPVHAVKVQRPVGAVDFVHTTVTLNCGGRWK